MSKLIFLADIDLKGSPVVRSHIREDVVEEYAEIYKRGKIKLPPIDLFTKDQKVYLLGDGSHRTYAALSLRQKTIEANIHSGGHEEALRFALCSNEKHGIRRTNADKRWAIREAIKTWPKSTDAQIAAIAGVDNHTVKDVRSAMEKVGDVKEEPVRINKDGVERPARLKEATGKSQSKSKEEVDGVGVVIPQFALTYWNRQDEVKELLGTLTMVHKFLVATQRKEDLMYGEVNFSAALGDLDKLISNLSTSMPYAVCTQCQGQPKTQPKGECRMCKGRGVISKFRWNTLVPSEIKKMREKKP